MQHINLYDPSLRLQRDWLGAESFAALVGLVLLAVVLAGLGLRWRAEGLQAPARDTAAALQVQQAAIQSLAQQLAGTRPDAKLLTDVRQTQAALEQRQAALQMLRSGALGEPQGHAAALAAFARQSIEGLWLTGLWLDRGDMALRGRAVSPDLIPAYVGRLNREPALQGRALRALDILRPLAAAEGASAPAGGTRAPLPHLAPFIEFSLAGSNGARLKEAAR